MDDVFNETFAEQSQGQGESQQPAQQPQQQPADGQQPAGAQQPQQPAQGEGAAPPAAGEQGTHVPLAALEAERKGRQDWKEKATRYEEQLKARDEELTRLRGQSQQPQQPQDPLQVMQQQIVNERFNTSELLVREKYQDTDDVIATFKEAAAKNPGLVAQMHAHPHPWKFAYEEGKRLRFAAEIGNDPEAYRKKVEEQVRAEILKSMPAAGQPAAQQPAIPQSLAGARSAGSRDTAWTGPTPMENLFPN